LLTGLTITSLRVPAFIATLGGLGMARGLTLLITDGRPVTDVPKGFARLGDGSFLGFIPVPVILLVLVAVIMSWVLRNTRLGRYA
jgi:ribose/xylose/arabinose/galactoside ABC-type transport system permease subunit